MQLLELWPMAKFHALIWQFENRPVSWKQLPIDQKEAQFRPTGVEREYMCNFWNSGQWQVPKYGKLANRPVSAWNLGQWPSWFSSRMSRPMGLLFKQPFPSLTWDEVAWFQERLLLQLTFCKHLLHVLADGPH